ncbi:hypothetical protein H9P43_009895 [Blastocladiella emersonii ATCC 22665]|nr:hypothetical protein H9P43_009890 [Blastocladiella emersonii ATCC 22665]KAI9149716.1 hypothetical protein H9P43_009895 [Blastocladiella emersonii ATCC 22665]
MLRRDSLFAASTTSIRDPPALAPPPPASPPKRFRTVSSSTSAHPQTIALGAFLAAIRAQAERHGHWLIPRDRVDQLEAGARATGTLDELVDSARVLELAQSLDHASDDDAMRPPSTPPAETAESPPVVRRRSSPRAANGDGDATDRDYWIEQLHARDAAIRVLEDRVRALTSSEAEVRRSLADVEAALAETTAAKSVLARDLVAARRTLSAVQAELADVTTQRDVHVTAARDLEAQLGRVRAAHGELRARADALEGHLDAALARNAELEADAVARGARETELESQIAALVADLAAARDHADHYSSDGVSGSLFAEMDVTDAHHQPIAEHEPISHQPSTFSLQAEIVRTSAPTSPQELAPATRQVLAAVAARVADRHAALGLSDVDADLFLGFLSDAAGITYSDVASATAARVAEETAAADEDEALLQASSSFRRTRERDPSAEPSPGRFPISRRSLQDLLCPPASSESSSSAQEPEQRSLWRTAVTLAALNLLCLVGARVGRPAREEEQSSFVVAAHKAVVPFRGTMSFLNGWIAAADPDRATLTDTPAMEMAAVKRDQKKK